MAKIYGFTKLLPAEAPLGIVQSPGFAVQLPEGFSVPALKNGTIGGNLSVLGSTSLFSLSVSSASSLFSLSVADSAQLLGTLTVGSSPSQLHTVTGLTTFNQETTHASVKFSGANNTSLGFYSSGSFTATLTGCTSSPTITVYYTRIGNQVILSSEGVSGTSNTTSMTLTGLPLFLYPATNKVQAHLVTDSGSGYSGRVDVTSSGLIVFYRDASTGGFTASGIKGVAGLTASYTIA
jgi:hypothetical protein